LAATSNTEQTTQSAPEENSTRYPSEDLQLVRVRDTQIFPRELFEDTADELMDEATVNRFYEMGPILGQNPEQIFLALLDPADRTVGILWLTYDPLFNALRIPHVAVLPEYRDGKVVEIATGACQELAQELGVEKLIGATQKMSKHWENLGWRTLNTQLIYQEVKLWVV